MRETTWRTWCRRRSAQARRVTASMHWHVGMPRGLCVGSLTRPEGVAPRWTDSMWFEVERPHEAVADRPACLIRDGVEHSFDRQPCSGGGAANGCQKQLPGTERRAGTVAADTGFVSDLIATQRDAVQLLGGCMSGA